MASRYSKAARWITPAPPAVRLSDPFIDWGTYLNYQTFNKNNDLPEGFADKISTHPWADTFGDLSTTPVEAVYCTDIRNHTYLPETHDASHPLVQSTSPTPNITSDMIPLLTNVLAVGEKYADTDNKGNSGTNYVMEENQIATQLAVWLIVERVYTCTNNDSKQIDSVLGGNDFPNNTQFAPNEEIGMKARAILSTACANIGKPQPIYPSFTSTDQSSAPTFSMAPGGSLKLTDANETLTGFPGALKVVDSGGLNITTNGNTMTLSGDPGAGCTMVTLSSDTAPGTLYYVSSTDKNDDGGPYQRQVRYVRAKGAQTPLYVKVCRGAATPGSLTVNKSVSPPNASGPGISDASYSFNLFGRDQSGTVTDFGSKQVGRDGSVTFDNLPLDQIYSLTEMTPSDTADWKYLNTVVPAAGMNLSQWNDLLTSSHQSGSVDVVNQYTPANVTTGDLTLQKSVSPAGAASQKADNFSFELIGTDQLGNTTSYFGEAGAGGTLQFTSLPTDCVYTLVETNQAIPGYTYTGTTAGGVNVTGWSTSVSDTAVTNVPVQNNYTPNGSDDASITVSKVANPPEAGTGQSYTFQLTGVTAGGTVLPPQTVTVPAGQSHTFTNLMNGATYTVTETAPGDAPGWLYSSTDMNGQAGLSWTGTLTGTGTSLAVTSTNSYTPQGSVSGSLTVGKAADPPQAGAGQSYTFTLSGVTAGGTVLPPQTVTVPAGQTYAFSNLMVGATYTVSESMPGSVQGYSYTFTDFDGTSGLSKSVTLTGSNPDQQTRATNHYTPDIPKTGRIRLRKCSCPPCAANGASVSFTLSGTSNLTGVILPPITQTVSSGSSVEFGSLPLDYTYSLSEAVNGSCPGWRLAGSCADGIPLSSWTVSLDAYTQYSEVTVTNQWKKCRQKKTCCRRSGSCG